MEKLGIYVHIPFCKKKCKYCDFVSFFCDENKIDLYFKKLYEEISLKNTEYLENRKITSIYIGGGTPSYPDSKYIVRILDELKQKFEISQNVEITIEINPGTINREKLLAYKNAGINRISIGLQSTQDRLLKIIGRIHNYNEFISTYNQVKEIGFKNINIDLMLALPTQTLEELIDDVNKIITLNPNHISIYSLILEEGTELKEKVKNGILELPSEELEREMYWKTKEILEKKYYNHYEISNFAKKGFESKHNMDCWNQEEYLGFGLSAHSYINNKRFSNTNDLEKYLKIKNFENNINIHEIQNKEDKIREYMILGLRKINGISISEFERKFRVNPLFYFRFEIDKLTKEKLIEVDLNSIRLTKKGLDFANIVFEEFI